MKSATSLIGIILSLLIISLPICFASEINIQTDENGNVIYDGEYFREYNGLNQLVRILNGTNSSAPLLQEFEHDPVEERIIKKVTYNPDGSPKETVIYFAKDFVRVNYHNGTVLDTEYVYFNGQMVAQVEESGDTYFMHGDNIGSTSVISDSWYVKYITLNDIHCTMGYTVRQILKDNWEGYRQNHNVPEHINSEVIKMIDCGKSSCNSRLCSSCGKRHVDNWSSWLSDFLLPVGHTHAVLTIPEALRPVLCDWNKLKMLMDSSIDFSANSGRTLA